MTSQTLLIVIRCILLQRLVRIVTGQTRDARIVCVMAAAIEHAIRLKANVVDSRLARQQHRLLKARMTRTAKRLRELVTPKPARIEDLRLVKLLRLHGEQMFLAWSMTGLATNTPTQAIE